jgi:CheY-like chemotaxis protein
MTQETRPPLALVVHDDAQVRQELARALSEDLGTRVVPAGSIDTACLVANEHPPDSDDPLAIVIVGMQLANRFEGIEALNTFKKYGLVSADCPVILFTARPTCEDCVKAIKLGASEYVPKMGQDGETGLDRLLRSCESYLFGRARAALRVDQTEAWLSRNLEWLCESFPGRWVALVPFAAAQEAGLDLEVRESIAIVLGDSREGLVRLIIKTPSVRRSLPPIFYLPPTRVELLAHGSED